MKIIKLLCIVILCCSTFVGFSGNIILYRKNGDVIPKETSQSWNTNADKKVFVYYNNEDKYPFNTTYKISISKRVGNIFIRIEGKEFPVQKGQVESITFFELKEPGDFILSVLDEQGYILSEQFYTVQK